MLCQFSFENFKSFKDEATLDFYAENITDNKESLIKDKKDGEKFLPVAVLYGPNGGGKSNVIEAITFLFSFILKSILDFKKPKLRINSLWIEQIVNIGYYHKFDKNCKKLPTKFKVIFRDKQYEFSYSISILNNDIPEENLYIREIGKKDFEIIFEKDGKETVLGKSLKDVSIGKLRNSVSLLSYLAFAYDIEIINKTISFFLKSYFINYSNPDTDKNLFLPDDEKIKPKVFSMLQEMGINIVNVRTEEDDKGNITEAYAKHPLEDGSLVEIPIDHESIGTKKVFTFLPAVIDSLQKGALIAIDELDAKLHPKLLKYVIGLFTNPLINKKGAQLILTSHDISTMNSHVFRRDEIWFCALNPNNASMLYSLSSIKESGNKIRKDASFGKQYLEGKYGADPYLRKILEWK